ncbi:MAG: enoyl-CoA hydratase/isomerase family protein [Bacteroidales bacterium]|jgi:enoyl-CoA hydratase/carnithine racemase|nr:enoyl-CoA hydratase/isomerase family protein [Bacteroidales bacterium]
METITSTEFFEISRKDAILIVRIKRNVFDFISDIDLSGKLMDFLENISSDTEIKALVFYNDPDCVNEEQYDKFLKRIMHKTKEDVQSFTPSFCEKNVRFREIHILNRFIKSLANLNIIVVSGTQGSIVTPFVGIALIADFIYARKGTKYIMAHNKYGLHPSGGLPFFLSSALHHSVAMEFQMKEFFTAEEAYKMGLINKVLPEQDFLDHLIEETEKFITHKQCTIQHTKRLTNFSRKSLFDYFNYESEILNL